MLVTLMSEQQKIEVPRMHSKATGGISSHVAHGRARRLVQDRRCVTLVVINLQPPACRTASEDEPWRFPRFPACFLLGAPLELPSPDKSCRHLLQMDMRSSSSLAVLIAPYAPQEAPTTAVVGQVAACAAMYYRASSGSPATGCLVFRAGT